MVFLNYNSEEWYRFFILPKLLRMYCLKRLQIILEVPKSSLLCGRLKQIQLQATTDRHCCKMQFMFIIFFFTSCSSAIKDWTWEHVYWSVLWQDWMNKLLLSEVISYRPKYTQFSALWIQETPVPPWLSSGKCYVQLEALKGSSLYPKQMHLSKQ